MTCTLVNRAQWQSVPWDAGIAPHETTGATLVWGLFKSRSGYFPKKMDTK